MNNTAVLRIEGAVAEARQALHTGLSAVLDRTLPAAWDKEQGKGWHEVWRTSSYGGFYASCEGAALLAGMDPTHPRFGEATAILQAVFHRHLCCVLESEGTAGLSPTQERTRRDVFSTTTKLARFLQAAAGVRSRLPDFPDRLVAKVAERLAAEGREGAGRWRCCLDAPRSHAEPLCATVEAVLALRAVEAERDEGWRAGVEYLGRLATARPVGRNDQMVLAIWALTELIDFVAPSILRKAAANLLQVLRSCGFNEVYVEKFSHPGLDTNDYYSFYLQANALTAFFRLGRHGFLRIADHMDAVVQVRDSARQVNDQIYQPEFWRHYYTLQLLDEFLRTMDQSSLRGSYMWVQPQVFHRQDFSVRPKLVVVIMPFSPSWSDEVFNGMRVPLEAKGYLVKRGDSTHKSDVIMQQVWEMLNEAALVIADCTTRNANVFYELGIAHALGKDVLLCAQERDEIPFDLQPIRSVAYGRDAANLSEVIHIAEAYLTGAEGGEA